MERERESTSKTPRNAITGRWRDWLHVTAQHVLHVLAIVPVTEAAYWRRTSQRGKNLSLSRHYASPFPLSTPVIGYRSDTR
ncbi:hypothetical protein J6590_028052 [Homalodisca vitripennis]|nr:hypothetical protein J6590_028052 [Homalodisca vitripennis]